MIFKDFLPHSRIWLFISESPIENEKQCCFHELFDFLHFFLDQMHKFTCGSIYIFLFGLVFVRYFHAIKDDNLAIENKKQNLLLIFSLNRSILSVMLQHFILRDVIQSASKFSFHVLTEEST